MEQTNYVKTIEPWKATPDQIIMVIAILIFIVGIAIAYNTIVEINTKNAEIIKEYNQTHQQLDLNLTKPTPTTPKEEKI